MPTDPELVFDGLRGLLDAPFLGCIKSLALSRLQGGQLFLFFLLAFMVLLDLIALPSVKLFLAAVATMPFVFDLLSLAPPLPVLVPLPVVLDPLFAVNLAVLPLVGFRPPDGTGETDRLDAPRYGPPRLGALRHDGGEYPVAAAPDPGKGQRRSLRQENQGAHRPHVAPGAGAPGTVVCP